MARNIRKQSSDISEQYKEGMSLGERLSVGAMGPVTHSGRGHGRKTNHGRRQKKVVPFRGKKDSIHFLEACVTNYRLFPKTNSHTEGFFRDGRPLTSTTEWARLLSRETQYFDCDVIWDYVSENYRNMYPDNEVPPSPDCVLPAENVALYLSEYTVPPQNSFEYRKPIEILFLCVPETLNLKPNDPYFRRHYHVFLITTNVPDDTEFTSPMPVGNIVVADTEDGPDHVFEELLLNVTADSNVQYEMRESLRMVAAMLQTINQPRYVRRAQRDVSQIKRQRIKNSLGRYIPDAWNMISWNVDAPVVSKTSDEGTGSRQGLHYRRGHWRKAESHWAGARWSETRLRWETYIHGYEAGHPKYGVLKSYHVPRKDKK